MLEQRWVADFAVRQAGMAAVCAILCRIGVVAVAAWGE